jgi:hypothetical protein
MSPYEVAANPEPTDYESRIVARRACFHLQLGRIACAIWRLLPGTHKELFCFCAGEEYRYLFLACDLEPFALGVFARIRSLGLQHAGERGSAIGRISFVPVHARLGSICGTLLLEEASIL